MSRRPVSLVMLLALGGGAFPLAGHAQTIGYGSVSSDSDTSSSDAGSSEEESGDRPKRHGGKGRTYVTPYIEAAQIVQADLSPGNDVVTYSQIAAGVEAGLIGRNSGASVSVRYERRFAHKKDARDGDTISGLARGYVQLAPGVQIDAGALASRSRVENSGAAVLGPLGDGSDVTQVYSAYAGPSVTTHVGDIKLDADYKIGYTRVDSPDAIVTAPGQALVDVFDDSISHMASVHAGVKPHDILPVGVGVGAAYYREDISNLDQRIEDKSARADLTLPLGTDLALVGGVGYEDVTISSRDALRDANGAPVVGRGGRFVTDKSGPRAIAYDTSGLIWDAGVVWRPSRRTALEAHVGRRYGSTSFYGSFAYSPSGRSSLNISVYDNVTGFGGQVTRSLAALPTQFQAVRNPLTGDLGGCVAAVQTEASEGSNCLSGALGSVRSSTFRGRGAMASYSLDLGTLQTGIGVGYDRRRFIGAPGTVLAAANGVVDENMWLAAFLGGRIDQHSSFSTNLYANWFQSGSGLTGDSRALGATAAYNRNLTDHLSATAAVGIDGVSREDPLNDYWTASALLGVRYSF